MTGMMKDAECPECGGEGRRWKSRYGGNDPDVWDAGPCERCEGAGTILIDLDDEIEDE